MKKMEALKKYSMFKIALFVSIAVLVVVIAIQIGIMINLKTKTQQVAEQNQEITSTLDDLYE